MKPYQLFLLCIVVGQLHAAEIKKTSEKEAKIKNEKNAKLVEAYNQYQHGILHKNPSQILNSFANMDKALREGADPNLFIANALGDYALLFWAIQQDDLALVQLLLEHNVNANYQDPTLDSETPLMGAITMNLSKKNYKAIIKLLIKYLAKQQENFNVQDKWGRTALWLAASTGQKDLIGLLLAQGANASIEPHADFLKKYPLPSGMREYLNEAAIDPEVLGLYD